MSNRLKSSIPEEKVDLGRKIYQNAPQIEQVTWQSQLLKISKKITKPISLKTHLGSHPHHPLLSSVGQI